MERLRNIVDNNIDSIGELLRTISELENNEGGDIVNNCITTLRSTIDECIEELKRPKDSYGASTTHSTNQQPAAVVKTTAQRSCRGSNFAKSRVPKEPKEPKVSSRQLLDPKIKWRKLTQSKDMKTHVLKMLKRMGEYWRKCSRHDLRRGWNALIITSRMGDTEATSVSKRDEEKSELFSPIKERREKTKRSIGVLPVAHAFGSSYVVPNAEGMSGKTSVGSRKKLYRKSSSSSPHSGGGSNTFFASALDCSKSAESMPVSADGDRMHIAELGVTSFDYQGTESPLATKIDVYRGGTVTDAVPSTPSSVTSVTDIQLSTHRDHESFSERDESDHESKDIGAGPVTSPSPDDERSISPELFCAETGEQIYSGKTAVSLLFASVQNTKEQSGDNGGSVSAPLRTVDEYWLGSSPNSNVPVATESMSFPSSSSDADMESSACSNKMDTEETDVTRNVSEEPQPVASNMAVASSVSSTSIDPLGSPSASSRINKEKHSIDYTPHNSQFNTVPNSISRSNQSTPSESEMLKELAAIRRQSLFSAVHLPTFSYLGSDIGHPSASKNSTAFMYDSGMQMTPEQRGAFNPSELDFDSLADGVEILP